MPTLVPEMKEAKASSASQLLRPSRLPASSATVLEASPIAGLRMDALDLETPVSE
jgi:hypothetical protein